jgi:hypothetical protein
MSDSTWGSSDRQLDVAQPKVPEQSTQQGTGHQSTRRNSFGVSSFSSASYFTTAFKFKQIRTIALAGEYGHVV